MADTEKQAASAKRTDEDFAVLKRHWTRKLRAQRAEIDKAAEKTAAERKVLTTLVNEAMADFGGSDYTRERMLGWVDIATRPIRTDMRKAQQEYEDRRDLGAYIHHEQQDMFSGLPDEVAEQTHWERIGEQDGLAGKALEAPKEMNERFLQNYAAGWHRSQTKIQEDYVAMQAMKKAGAPDAAVKPVDLNAAAKPDSPDGDVVDLDKRRSGTSRRSVRASEEQVPA